MSALFETCSVCNGKTYVVKPGLVGALPSNDWCPYCKGHGRILTPAGREAALIVELVTEGRLTSQGWGETVEEARRRAKVSSS